MNRPGFILGFMTKLGQTFHYLRNVALDDQIGYPRPSFTLSREKLMPSMETSHTQDQPEAYNKSDILRHPAYGKSLESISPVAYVGRSEVNSNTGYWPQ